MKTHLTTSKPIRVINIHRPMDGHFVCAVRIVCALIVWRLRTFAVRFGETEYREWERLRPQGLRRTIWQKAVTGGSWAFVLWFLGRNVRPDIKTGDLTLLMQVVVLCLAFALHGLAKWRIMEANYLRWRPIDDSAQSQKEDS